MFISCDIIGDLLPGYADGVCSEDTRELIELHCEGCEECRRKLEAMREPLPVNKENKSPKNPMKKARQHYIKLAAVTALCFILIAIPFTVIFGISLNESLQSRGISWSSIAAKNEMNSVGRLIMRGDYEKAFDRVGFIGADRQPYNGGEVDFLRDKYAEFFGDFFDNHPVTGVETEGSLYGSTGMVTGRCSLTLDPESTEGYPLVIQMTFERRDGQVYIDRIYPAIADGKPVGDSEAAHEMLWKMLNELEIYNYPGTDMITELDNYFGGGRPGETSVLYTREQMELDEKSAIMHTKAKEEMTDEELAAAETAGKKYSDYVAARSEAIAGLLNEDYRYVSLSGGEISYCDEPIYEGLIYEHFQCYRQPVTVNMQTLAGEAFTVSFVMKHHFTIECPLENISYSDNAPEDFRREFERLFGEGV